MVFVSRTHDTRVHTICTYDYNLSICSELSILYVPASIIYTINTLRMARESEFAFCYFSLIHSIAGGGFNNIYYIC